MTRPAALPKATQWDSLPDVTPGERASRAPSRSCLSRRPLTGQVGIFILAFAAVGELSPRVGARQSGLEPRPLPEFRVLDTWLDLSELTSLTHRRGFKWRPPHAIVAGME